MARICLFIFMNLYNLPEYGCSFLQIYTNGQNMVVHFYESIQLARIWLLIFTNLYKWQGDQCSFLQIHGQNILFLEIIFFITVHVHFH